MPSASFESVGVRGAGRSARLAFALRAGSKPADVDVFQTSRGRRVIPERLVARFGGRAGSVEWNGRANRRGRRVTDGYYFVRFRSRSAGGELDARRVTLRRANGRFSVRPAFYRRATCDLVRSFKLQRPVFGGSGRARRSRSPIGCRRRRASR